MNAQVMELRIKQWLPIFEAQANSGLGKDKWCEENGVRRWEFYKRQREIRSYLLGKAEVKDGESAFLNQTAPEFVELSTSCVVNRPAQTVEQRIPAGRIEITHKDFRIHLEGSVDNDTLETVLRIIAHA